MTTNPLRQAIQSATRANTEIGNSFGRFGTSEHPRGFVLSAYRNANRALGVALQEDNPLQASQEVMRGLRVQLRSDLRTELGGMQAFGIEEARRQLSYYGISLPATIQSTTLSQTLDTTVAALMAKLDAQAAQLNALIITDASPDQILGNDDRRGVLKPGDTLAGSMYWTAVLVWDAFSWLLSQQQQTFQKQAIAALDGRTTDCCLQVHGQIQPLKGLFQLTGDPHFSDKMDWAPFHWYCRTSICLYQPAFDDGSTDELLKSAALIMAERAAGGTGDRHPANAHAG